jgi:hypothetical protein
MEEKAPPTSDLEPKIICPSSDFSRTVEACSWRPDLVRNESAELPVRQELPDLCTSYKSHRVQSPMRNVLQPLHRHSVSDRPCQPVDTVIRRPPAVEQHHDPATFPSNPSNLSEGSPAVRCVMQHPDRYDLIEGCIRKRQMKRVGLATRGPNEAPGPLRCRSSQVNTDHCSPTIRKRSGNFTRPTPDIEDRLSLQGLTRHELAQPTPPMIDTCCSTRDKRVCLVVLTGEAS